MCLGVCANFLYNTVESLQNVYLEMCFVGQICDVRTTFVINLSSRDVFILCQRVSDCIWHCKFSLLLYQYIQAGLLYWNHVSKCHHVCNVASDNLCSCETSWKCGIDANPVNMNSTTNIFSQQLANGYRNSRNTHWPSEDSLHPDQPIFFAPSAYFFVCLIWTWLEGPVRHYCILKKRLKVLEWHVCKHSVQLGYIGLYHESLLTMYFRDQNERLTIYMFNMATTLICPILAPLSVKSIGFITRKCHGEWMTLVGLSDQLDFLMCP